MTPREVMQRLRQEGWAEHSGKHVKFTKDRRMVVVPNHYGDLKTGTLRAIYRDAGWSWPAQP